MHSIGGSGWSSVDLEIMLIRYYSKVNPSNMHVSKGLASHFAGSRSAYLSLNKQLLDEYGTDLEQMLTLTGKSDNIFSRQMRQKNCAEFDPCL